MQHVLIVNWTPEGSKQSWTDCYGPFDTWSDADAYRTLLGKSKAYTADRPGEVDGKIVMLSPPLRDAA